MRAAVLSSCIVVLAAGLPAAQETQRGDEQSLRDFAGRFVQRWNTKDASGLAGLFNPVDGTVRLSSRTTIRGGDAIAGWLKSYPDFKQLDATPRQVHFLNAVLASFNLMFGGAAPGAETHEAPAWELTVMRGAGDWRVLRLRQVAEGTTAVARVGGTIQEPRKLKTVPPVYPDEAKQARIQGAVVLECTISPEGAVTAVEVLTGDPLLAPAAVEAVKQWAYTPTLLNGVAVPVIMTITVNFRLR